MSKVTDEPEVLETTRTDLFKIDPRSIIVEDGFNERRDFEGQQELVDSIRENGVRVPLKGYFKDGNYVLTDGERRLRACLWLIENEGLALRVPFVSGKKPSETERLLDMLLCNEGKKFNPVETSAVITRLLAYGLEPKEVAAKLGITQATVSNLVLLATVSPKLKKKIIAGEISSTLVLQLIRGKNGLSAETIEQQIETILGAETSTGEEKPKGGKVTNKKLKKAKGVEPSMAYFKTLLKKARKQNIDVKRNHDLWLTLVGLVDGLYTEQAVENLFWD